MHHQSAHRAYDSEYTIYERDARLSLVYGVLPVISPRGLTDDASLYLLNPPGGWCVEGSSRGTSIPVDTSHIAVTCAAGKIYGILLISGGAGAGALRAVCEAKIEPRCRTAGVGAKVRVDVGPRLRSRRSCTRHTLIPVNGQRRSFVLLTLR